MLKTILEKIKNYRKRIIATIIFVAILVLGCYYLVSHADTSLILSRHWSFWVSQISILLIYFLLATAFLAVLIRAMGVSAPFFDLFLILNTSQSTSYLGPLKLGIPLRIYLFKKVMGASYTTGISATILSQYIRVLAIVIICAAGVITRYWQYKWMLVLVIFLMISAIIVAIFAFRWIKNTQPEKKLLIRIKTFAVSLAEKAAMLSLSKWIVSTAITLLMCVVMTSSSYFIIITCGGTISFANVLYIDAFALLVGFLSLMPMGLGTRDATYLFLLTSAGIPKEIVCTIILIQRFIWSVVPIAMGIVSSLILVAKIFRMQEISDSTVTDQQSIQQS